MIRMGVGVIEEIKSVGLLLWWMQMWRRGESGLLGRREGRQPKSSPQSPGSPLVFSKR